MRLRATTPTVSAPDGAPLAWHEAGRGRPLLLLPGLSLGLVCWAPLMPSRLGHRLAMDVRGTGRSRPWSGAQTVDAYAEDAVRVLDAAGRCRRCCCAPTGRQSPRSSAPVLALPDSSVAHLRRVRTPVLLVHGGRDRLAPPGDTARLLSVLPDTRAVVVSPAGHLAQLRVPTVRRAARAFLHAADGVEVLPS